MKPLLSRVSLVSLVAASAVLGTAQEVRAQDTSVPARWKQHEMNRPRPQPATPAAGVLPTAAPADAIVLFDGKDLARWQGANGSAAGWQVKDGYFQVQPGAGPIQTRDAFGDVQMHVEWASPNPPAGSGQNRGNSGVFLMERYEVQVLDSHQAETYADGQAGAIYGQYPPLFNATRAPGEWQAYDIFFRRPRFATDGKLIEPARLTVLHNGILIQNNEELRGITSWLKTLPYEAHADKAPIQLQDHGSPVRFRNIWLREIPARPEPDASYAAQTKPIPMSASQLDRYVGVYNRGEGANAAPITITREGDQLLANFHWRPGQLPLIPVSPAEFVLTETAGRIVFDLNRRGLPTALTFHLGGDRQVARKVK